MTSTYDLLVIGGGITGAGVARDAALRGMKVALFEKNDFGSGTSSKSSKMIHGGLRYLEHGEIGLVFESVSERRVQTRAAPHLVRPMPFLVPIYDDTKPGLELMNVGLWIYDSLALFRAPRMHKTFRGAKAALELEPGLATQGLRGVLEYFDCATDDARLVLENILDARELGADCRNYCEVVALGRDASGRIRSVTVRDGLSGVTDELFGHAVVLAAGAWTDEAIKRLEVGVARDLLRRTKGVHLVFPRERLPLSRAITLLSPVDGRVMFAIPWRERTVIGTTDTDFTGTADEVWADADDAEYLCASINRYFPGAQLTPGDIIATWAGLRPLIRSDHAESESEVSREHEIFVRDDGMLIVAGGKLTTYRLMAKEVVNKAVRWLEDHVDGVAKGMVTHDQTKDRPLPGAAGLEEPTLEALARAGQALMSEFGIDADTATHLCSVYGTRAPALCQLMRGDAALAARINPDLPYLWAEVDFAIRHELAKTIDDVLGRRVPILLVGRDQGLDVCERVGHRLGELLRLAPATVAQQVAAYRQVVETTRRFRR